MGSSTIITVDHLDPRLRFSGSWFSSRSPGESVVTARATQSAGSFLTFTFSGTSVAVYGTVETSSRSGPPKSTYCLDDGPVITFNVTPSDNVQHVMYFNATSLSETEHTLVVTSATDSATFWVDYISYVPIATSQHRKRVVDLVGLDTPSPSTITQSADTLLTSSGSTSDIPSSITFTTPPSSPASPSTAIRTASYISHTNTKAIAGGVVGGVVFLAVVLVVYYYFGHRITHKRSASTSRERAGRRLSIEPGMRSPGFKRSKRPTSNSHIEPFRYHIPATVGDSDTSESVSAADMGQTSPTVEDTEENSKSSRLSIRPLPLLPPPGSGVDTRSSLRLGSSSGSTLSGHGSFRRELPRRPLPSTPLPRQASVRSLRPRTAPKRDPPTDKITRPQTAPQFDPPPAYE